MTGEIRELLEVLEGREPSTLSDLCEPYTRIRRSSARMVMMDAIEAGYVSVVAVQMGAKGTMREMYAIKSLMEG